MPVAPILITGFEPYGGHGRNPSFEAMQALDGRTIAGAAIVGRGLPVSMTRLRPALAALLDEREYGAIISLGLQPGAGLIHLERSAANLADFDIADNDGLDVQDAELSPGGPAARFATLPLRAIERAMLAAGIPSRLSPSAGTYLCNACLYCTLEAVEAAQCRAASCTCPACPNRWPRLASSRTASAPRCPRWSCRGSSPASRSRCARRCGRWRGRDYSFTAPVIDET
jgi:pyroglutamyl-peptidase